MSDKVLIEVDENRDIEVRKERLKNAFQNSKGIIPHLKTKDGVVIIDDDPLQVEWWINFKNGIKDQFK